jgi:polysaccharide export outer membrane protein
MRLTICSLALLLTTAGSALASGRAQLATPTDYIVGAHDALTITSYDQADLTGKFEVEADGTFTYPLIGRVAAGGLTLRQIEAELRNQLVTGGFFKKPQITVSIEKYRSQKIFVVGEVRSPGSYAMSGDMHLIEALALAGSTLPTASGEAVIVSPAQTGAAPVLPNDENVANVVRVNLRDLERGNLTENPLLADGDTVFVLRAESIYVFGQIKNPGAYPLRQKDTTVLQALSLAGGLTDRGTSNRIKIIRVVNGSKIEIDGKLTDVVLPSDTIVVPQRFF